MLMPAQEFVNGHGRTLAAGHAVDDQTWTEDAVAASEDAVCGGHQGLRIHSDQAAGRDFDAILGLQEIKLGRLTNGHDDSVAVQLSLAALVEGRIEALVLIEDPLGVERLERDHSATPADHSLGT